jgi:esterase/lipase superfamily enzyme
MRHQVELSSQAIGDSTLLEYGSYGPPVIVFPSDAGRASDWENLGMFSGIQHLIDGGRVKLYCVDSYDSASWRNRDIPLEERAQHHQRFEDYLVYDVVPFIYDDCHGRQDILLTGCSFGGYHAANLALRRADLFPVALCMSGVYDMVKIGWGDRSDTFYFHNPMDYVSNMHGEHLDWLRSRVFLQLVCGQGAWEDESASGSLPSTLRFQSVLAEKGIPHHLDLWGHDSKHDWDWWAKQVAYHLPRLL